MSIDNKLLEQIISNKIKIDELIIQNRNFPVMSSELNYSEVPVNKPTTRGGVYFSDTKAFKAKVVVQDKSLSSILPGLMLGPNSEFAKINLVARNFPALVFANLTNYVQKSTGFELNLTIIEASTK